MRERREVHSEIQAAFSKVRGMIQAEQFNPRAAKLMHARIPFLVVACHEPYFIDVYRLIREQEKKQGTWTETDEGIFKRRKKAHRMDMRAYDKRKARRQRSTRP